MCCGWRWPRGCGQAEVAAFTMFHLLATAFPDPEPPPGVNFPSTPPLPLVPFS